MLERPGFRHGILRELSGQNWTFIRQPVWENRKRVNSGVWEWFWAWRVLVVRWGFAPTA